MFLNLQINYLLIFSAIYFLFNVPTKKAVANFVHGCGHCCEHIVSFTPLQITLNKNNNICNEGRGIE
jgi:hypothetical protein